MTPVCTLKYRRFALRAMLPVITLRPICALPSPPSRQQAMPPVVNVLEEDRATEIGNMYKHFGKGRACGFGDILADRQTDGRTTHHNTSQPLARAKCPAGSDEVILDRNQGNSRITELNTRRSVPYNRRTISPL